jgi:hypothetical protein
MKCPDCHGENISSITDNTGICLNVYCNTYLFTAKPEEEDPTSKSGNLPKSNTGGTKYDAENTETEVHTPTR